MRSETTAQSDADRHEATSVRVIEIDARAVASQAQSDADRSLHIVDELSGTPSTYTVGPADVLQVTVWDHPELAAAQGQLETTSPRPADAPQGFVVDQNGDMQFPYVGRVRVAGLDTAAIQLRLTTKLREYFQDPQVTVRVASYRSKQVLIDGEVHAPGAQQVNDVPMTLTEAIGRAGGFTPAADQGRILLVRDGRSYVLNIPDMVQRGKSPSNIMLRRGDVLRVTSRDQSGIFVMGEVARPITAIPKQDGTLSLADALSQAGSFNPSTSNPQQLYVVRGAQGHHPEVFHLNARSPVSMVIASRFHLQPDDIVYVDATDLVRVNRVLNLLLPAIDAGLTAAIATK
ncbi:polysaccharide biosynthesis/export family protein [Paraburkholderia sp. BL6665CI2N2]|uniref:polysaccharide biosynthesis/export family protein n=1 Tax=Paraburkholderia sp. BL6665CI2N2 TaxID=1938806 RepID=UPI001FBC10DE|nr:polysaccharide biosynthesis/export family protein [Paraburkholderia sp. BL6665CI2N2]